jgi:hypothetical protein
MLFYETIVKQAGAAPLHPFTGWKYSLQAAILTSIYHDI